MLWNSVSAICQSVPWYHAILRDCWHKDLIVDSSCRILVKFMGSKSKLNSHFTGDNEYFTISTLINFSKWVYTVSEGWEFSPEFSAFNLARARETSVSAFLSLCKRSRIRSYPNAASSGLLSTRTAKGRTGGVKCVVILPQSVFPSLQLSVVCGVPE